MATVKALPSDESLPIEPITLKTVSLKPGDVLCLFYPGVLKQAARKHLDDHMKDAFPDNRCLVLQEGIELSVIGPERLETASGQHANQPSDLQSTQAS